MRESLLPLSLAGLLLCVTGCVNRPLLLRNRPNVPPPMLAPSSSPDEIDSYDGVAEPISAQAALPVPVIKTPQVTYTVVKRDSFWKIARKYGVDKSELAAYNNMSLDKPLKIGVVLLIPPGGVVGGKATTFASKWKSGSVVRNAPPKKRVEGSMGANGGTYVVRPKDSIWKIARQHDITTKALVEANRLDPRKPIKPGMKLIIPGRTNDSAEKTSVSDPTSDLGSTDSNDSPTPNSSSDSDVVNKTPPATDDTDLLDDAAKAVDSPKTGKSKKKSVEEVLDELDSSSVKEGTSSEVPGAPYTEEVIPNETLQEIADRHGCTVEEILKVNPSIKSEDDLKPFTSIVIPKK